MRPSALTHVISAKTIAAPPTARAPRWTRCQSPTVPSVAEYCAMGDTTTRFLSVTPRRVKGVNIGGGGLRPAGTATPARRANHDS